MSLNAVNMHTSQIQCPISPRQLSLVTPKQHSHRITPVIIGITGYSALFSWFTESPPASAVPTSDRAVVSTGKPSSRHAGNPPFMTNAFGCPNACWVCQFLKIKGWQLRRGRDSLKRKCDIPALTLNMNSALGALKTPCVSYLSNESNFSTGRLQGEPE
jgi:hypothetical protein